jgi:hypothetical protein
MAYNIYMERFEDKFLKPEQTVEQFKKMREALDRDPLIVENEVRDKIMELVDSGDKGPRPSVIDFEHIDPKEHSPVPRKAISGSDAMAEWEKKREEDDEKRSGS